MAQEANGKRFDARGRTLFPSSGSVMATKQLLETVRHGRQVRCEIVGLDRWSIEGYLAGIDDYHYLIVDDEGEKWLVHKTQVVIHLGSTSTFDDEPHREKLEEIVGPFRRRVLSDYFHIQEQHTER